MIAAATDVYGSDSYYKPGYGRVAAGRSGRLFALGETSPTLSNVTRVDIYSPQGTLVKEIYPTGNQYFLTTGNGQTGATVSVGGIRQHNDGFLLVGGASKSSVTNVAGAWLGKYTDAGDLAWEGVVSVQGQNGGPSANLPYAVGADVSGNTYGMFYYTTGPVPLFVKINNSGQVVFGKTLTFADSSLLSSFFNSSSSRHFVVADDAGNSYFVANGTSTLGTALVVKFNATGGIVFAKIFGSAANSIDGVTRADITPDALVLLANGKLSPSRAGAGTGQTAIIKINKDTGAVIAASTVPKDSDYTGTAYARDVVADKADGSVFVTMDSGQTNSTQAGAWFYKFNSAGTLVCSRKLWRPGLSGAAGYTQRNFAHDIDIDAAGNVVIGASLSVAQNPNNYNSAELVKLSPDCGIKGDYTNMPTASALNTIRISDFNKAAQITFSDVESSDVEVAAFTKSGLVLTPVGGTLQPFVVAAPAQPVVLNNGF